MITILGMTSNPNNQMVVELGKIDNSNIESSQVIRNSEKFLQGC